MPETPIDQVAELQPYQLALKTLGYRTLELFLGAVHAAGPAAARYLNTDPNALVARLPQAARHRLAAFAAAPPLSPLPLGVALHYVPRPRTAFHVSLPLAAAAAPPVPAVNLIAQMPAIRDQGGRGTCVTFAALSVVEHYAGLQGAPVDLSEQFLYCDCKRNDGHPNEYGTWLGVAFPCLNRDGCCLESTWPYNPNVIPGDEGQCPPPPGAQTQALSHRVGTYHQLSPTSVQDVKHELQRQRCVAFSVPVFDSWLNNTEVRRTGEIVLPFPGEGSDGGHAMCIVGYQDEPGEIHVGGGRFLLRNSWNTYWATESQYGAGYGTIPYAYIARYGAEAYSID